METKKTPRAFVLDARALARAKASDALALDPRAFGRTMMLADRPFGSSAPEVTEGGVAIVRVSGPLTQRATGFECGFGDGYDAIEGRFAAALASDATAVVLVVDSPGGDVAGLLETTRRMREAKDAAGKPVIAFADELAASAAYAIASVADEVYAPASGEVGSVGVVSIHVDETRALEADGLKVTVFRSGARKAEGGPFEALSEEARARMQARVDDRARQFAEFVAETRGIDVPAVLALEGECFGAAAAVEVGLLDGVSTFEKVIGRVSGLASRSAIARAAATVRPAPRAAEERTPFRLADVPEPRAAAAGVRTRPPRTRPDLLVSTGGPVRVVSTSPVRLVEPAPQAVRRYEHLTFEERAELRSRGPVGAHVLAELEADWRRRGSPQIDPLPRGEDSPRERYELLTPGQKVRMRDTAEGAAHLETLRAEWEKRGRPLGALP